MPESIEDAEFKIWHGAKLEKQGKLKEAIAYYRQAVRLDHQSTKARQMLEVALRKQGQLSEATINYDQAFSEIKSQDSDKLLKTQNIQNNNQCDASLRNNISSSFLSDWTETNPSNSKMYGQKKSDSSSLVLNQLDTQDNRLSPNWSSPALVAQNGSHQQEKVNDAITLPTINAISSVRHTTKIELEVAQIYLHQALTYFSQQKWQAAISSCEKSLKICPDFAEAYKVWGNVLLRMGKVAEAIGCYAKAIEINPNMAEAYANLGTIYAKQKKWQQSREYYQKSLLINPNSAGVYRNLTKIWEELAEENQAIECFFQALKLEPEILTPQQYFQLAQELLKEEKRQKAIICYQYAIKLEPSFKDAYLKLIAVLSQEGEWQTAHVYRQKLNNWEKVLTSSKLQRFKRKRFTGLLASSGKILPARNNSSKELLLTADSSRSREITRNISKGNTSNQNSLPKIDLAIQQCLRQANLDPDSSTIQANLGSLYARQQNWQKAIAHNKKAIELNPKFALAYRNLAKVLAKIGKSAQALEVLYKSYSLEPKSASGEAHFQLGNQLLEQNKLEKASACYGRAMQLQPMLMNVCLSLGQYLERKHNRPAAVICYQQVIKHEPGNAQAYFLLGKTLAKEKKWRKATICYRQTVKLKPDFGQAYHNLGNVLARQEQWSEAITSYRRAIELNPDLAHYHHNCAEVLLRQQKWNEGIEAYEEAYKLDPNLPGLKDKLDKIKILVQKSSDSKDSFDNNAIALESESKHSDDNFLADSVQPTRIEPKIAQLESNIQFPDDNYMSYQHQGLALIKQGRVEEAIENFYRAIKLDPENSWNYYHLAEILVKQDKLEEAVRYYYKVIELDPDFVWSYYHLGNVLIQLRKPEEAVNAYRGILQLQETGKVQLDLDQIVVFYEKLADTLGSLGEAYADEAIEYYCQAIEITPLYRNLYYRAIELKPEDP